MITNQEKAKILLLHGSYKKYILNLLNKYILGSVDVHSIEEMLSDFFLQIVDQNEIKEDILDHNNDIDEDQLEDCMFEDWEEAWNYYKNECIEEVSSFLRKDINIDINDIDLAREIYLLIENEAEKVVF